MKTNQMLNVKINDDLTVRIGHLTQMGKVDNILAYGNLLREQRGLKPVTMDSILKKQEFWEFVIARNAQKVRESQTAESSVWDKKGQTADSAVWVEADFTELEKYKDEYGKINYSKLIKQFPLVIKSQRGGKVENRGYWADLYILLKIASMLDKTLEVEIYKTFIEGRICKIRDVAGDLFKELNKRIDNLPDRKGKDNKGCFIQIANKIKEKIGMDNVNDIDEKVVEKRKDIENKLCMLIDSGYVRTYRELKEAIDRITQGGER